MSFGEKIFVINPDGSIKQLSTDANGNLNVNAQGVTLSVTATPALAAFDVNSTTVQAQINADTTYRDEVTILAEENNTADIKVGVTSGATFPLSAGSSVTIRKTQLSLIFHKAVSGTQVLHIICGGN